MTRQPPRESEEEMSRHYVVFERPRGSKCWTLAHGMNGRAIHHTLEKWAKADARWVRKNHRGWKAGVPNKTPMQAHVAEIELPE